MALPKIRLFGTTGLERRCVQVKDWDILLLRMTTNVRKFNSLRLSCLIALAGLVMAACDTEYSNALSSIEGKDLIVVQIESVTPNAEGDPTVQQTAHAQRCCANFKSQMEWVKGMKGLDASWVLPAKVIKGSIVITYTTGKTGKSKAGLCACCFER
jgi:hypothetical protein